MTAAPPPPGQKDRLGALDGLRAAAIILVVLCHVSLIVERHLGHSYQVFGLRPLTWFLMNGWSGVELFFVLSGFLITRQLLPAFNSPDWKRAVATYLKRRFFRIAPAFYAAMTLVGLMLLPQLWPLSGENAKLWLSTWASHLAFLPACFSDRDLPYWSLVTEARFYLIAPLLVLALPRVSLRARAALLAAAIAALTACNILWALQHLPHDHTEYFVTLVIPFRRSVTCCLCGMLCCLVWSDAGLKQKLAGRGISNAMFVAGLAVFLGVTAGSPSYFDLSGEGLTRFSAAAHLPLLALAFPLMLLGLLGDCSVRKYFEGKILRGIALISYSVYLVHFMFIDAAWLHIEKWIAHAGPTAQWLALLAAVLSYTLPLATLSYFLIEKPFIDWAHGRRSAKA